MRRSKAARRRLHAKNSRDAFFVSNQPPPLHPRPHPTLKCVLDAIADRRSRRAKGRRPKCDDAAKSQIRGSMFCGLCFRRAASFRAIEASTLMVEVNLEVPKRSWCRGDDRGGRDWRRWFDDGMGGGCAMTISLLGGPFVSIATPRGENPASRGTP